MTRKHPKSIDHTEFTEKRILRVGAELHGNVMDWAAGKYDADSFAVAWVEFTFGMLGPIEFFEETDPMGSMFLAWWMYARFPEEGEGSTPVSEYLGASAAPRDAFERRLAHAIEAAPFSFHRVEAVDPGRSLTVVDVLRGTRCEVLERHDANERNRSMYIFGRVVQIDGVELFFGSGPFIVEPAMFPFIKALRDQLQEQVGRVLTPGDLHEFAPEIRAKYMRIAASILYPAPPQINNTDGDPIVLVRLIYDLRCDCETAFKKLRTLAKGLKKSELLDRVDHDEAGRMTGFAFNWTTKRKPGYPGAGNLIVAHMVVEDGRLEIEINSRKRANRARRMVARRLGSAAEFRHEVVTSIEQIMKERDAADTADDAELEAVRRSPEFQAAAAKSRSEHWTSWLDQSIPALGGRTPREAVTTVEGRELLEALLADYDFKNREMPDNPMKPDTAALRRELGVGVKRNPSSPRV